MVIWMLYCIPLEALSHMRLPTHMSADSPAEFLFDYI